MFNLTENIFQINCILYIYKLNYIDKQKLSIKCVGVYSAEQTTAGVISNTQMEIICTNYTKKNMLGYNMYYVNALVTSTQSAPPTEYSVATNP